MLNLGVGRPTPETVSHLATVYLGIPIVLYDNTTGASTDPTVFAVSVAFVPRNPDGTPSDPTGLFQAAVWHHRPDDDGIVRPVADLLIGPGSSVQWPALSGDLDPWYQLVAGAETIIEQAPGRVVLT